VIYRIRAATGRVSMGVVTPGFRAGWAVGRGRPQPLPLCWSAYQVLPQACRASPVLFASPFDLLVTQLGSMMVTNGDRPCRRKSKKEEEGRI
jgi:hypothetical protein